MVQVVRSPDRVVGPALAEVVTIKQHPTVTVLINLSDRVALQILWEMDPRGEPNHVATCAVWINKSKGRPIG